MPLQAPRTLAEVWNLPVGAFNQGMRGYEQAQQMDDLTLAGEQSKQAYDAQRRPLDLADIASQTRAREDSILHNQELRRGHKLQNDFAQDTYGPKLEEFVRSNRAKITEDHVKEMERAGQVLQMLSADAKHNASPGYQGRIRQRLEQLNLGGMWNPQWDNMDPVKLSEALGGYGGQIMQSMPKLQQLMALQELKNEGALATADKKGEHAAEVARIRGQLAAKVAAIRKASSGGGGKAPSRENMSHLKAALYRARAAAVPGSAEHEALDTTLKGLLDDEFMLKQAGAVEKMVPDPKAVGGVIRPAAKPESPFKKDKPPAPAAPKLGTKENPIKLD